MFAFMVTIGAARRFEKGAGAMTMMPETWSVRFREYRKVEIVIRDVILCFRGAINR